MQARMSGESLIIAMSISAELDLDGGKYRAYLDDIGKAATIAHDPDETASPHPAERGSHKDLASVSEH
jgi:hypothetical protein